MKLTLYNAISIDGFIATKNNDSDWVSEHDWKIFDEECNKADAIIMGRITYEQFKGDSFPIKGRPNLIMTSKEGLETQYKNVFFVNSDPEKLYKHLKKEGFKNPLLIGGGVTNASFLEARVIDEIILDIHPIIIGHGIKLFETDVAGIDDLVKIESKEIEGGQLLVKYAFPKK